MTHRINVNLSDEVFQHIEKLRGNVPHFRSGYIDGVLRKEFNLHQKVKR